MTQVYLSPPDVGALEELHLVRALRSGWVAPLGPEVDGFEADLALTCGRQYAVALSSGTAALHLGLLALGVGPGDVVVTSSMTFAATANAIVYSGAEPFFVDSGPDGNLDPDLLEASITELIAQGRKPAALLPVDLLGKVANHERIGELSRRFDIPVLSDAAESLGATRGGVPAAAFGRAAAVSFNGNKVMTTSGGGTLLTDDAALADRVRHLATQARQPVAHYEHREIGFNYRMSNLLAAMGRAQLIRLPQMLDRRRAIRAQYREIFDTVDGVSIFGGGNDAEDNHWLTAILVDSEVTGWTTAQLAAELREQRIESRPLWKPMHLQPVFAGNGAKVSGVSERLFSIGLTLPSGSGMDIATQMRVVQAIGRFLRRTQ